MNRLPLLHRWIDALRAPSLPWTPDLSPAVLRFGIERTLEGWAPDLLAWEESGAPPARDHSITAGVVLPANSPAPLMNTIAAALLRNLDLFLKPSRPEAYFVREWVERFSRHLEANPIDVVDDLDLSRCDRLVVFGRDETVEGFRKSFGRDADFFGFGHRFSVAYLETPDPTAPRAVARDIATWNQNGCLSPQTVFVAERFAENFAKTLASELAALEETVPRGPVPLDVAHRIRVLRAEVAARETGAVFGSPAGTSWTVLYDALPDLEKTPLERTIWVRAVDGWNTVADLLAPDLEHLEAIGVAADEAARERTVDFLGGDADRVLPIGMMQSPRLMRRHSGLPSLALNL